MKYKKTMIGIGLALILLAAYWGAQIYIERSAEKEVDREIEKIASFADIRYRTLRFDLFKQRFTLEGIQLAPRLLEERFIIDTLSVDRPKGGSESPVRIHLKIQGFRPDPGQKGHFLKPFLEDMGYANVSAHMECDASYDERKHILEIARLHLGADKMGDAEGMLRVENLNLDQMKSIPKNAVLLLAMASAVSVSKAEVIYTDDSLMPNVHRLLARRKNRSIDAHIDDLDRQMALLIQKETDPGARRVLERIRTFARAPDKITVRLNPQRPVSVLQLFMARNLAGMIALLGMDVSLR